ERGAGHGCVEDVGWIAHREEELARGLFADEAVLVERDGARGVGRLGDQIREKGEPRSDEHGLPLSDFTGGAEDHPLARREGGHATLGYLPVNLAGRFSTYAVSPSFASSLWKSCCCSSRSMASASLNETSSPDWTERLMRPTAFDALLGGTNWRAYSITFASN